MSRELQRGQRVRVTVRNRLAGYQPGDKGTVLRVSTSTLNGEHSYSVAMDKDDLIITGAVFKEGEIEPDV